MNDEWSDLMRKAISCQGEGDMKRALLLWQRAAVIAPLDHVGRFNYLLCRRTLAPKDNYASESLELAENAVTTHYFVQCLIIGMLCTYDAKNYTGAANVAMLLARRVMELEQKGANIWDLPGEPTLLVERGSAIEIKSGATIINCLQTLIRALPRGAHCEKPMEELLQRYRAREKAMHSPALRQPPANEAWWKFW